VGLGLNNLIKTGKIKVISGLEKFRKKLHPEIVAEIKGWSNHPELSKLLEKLQSIKDWEQFVDYYAEAIVAWYLIRQGCEIDGYEVPNDINKTADFQVSKGRNTFFLHIKRLNFDGETHHDFNVSKRLEGLQEKGIGYSFDKSLADEEMQHFYEEAKNSSKEVKVGETKDIISETGEILGQFAKVSNGQSAAYVYSAKSGDDRYRFSDKISEAYKQFMPNAMNVILVTSAWRDSASIEDLQRALDDSWAVGKHSCSNIVGWFEFDPRENSIDFKLFFRENSKIPQYIIDVFEQDNEVITT
jgi:hypothetical protein